jgi:phage/plasmid-like protein (TIGR03299 family)
MAHLVDTLANGKHSLAFIGATPWHGLGQKLTEGATIEEWLKESTLDYEVLRAAVTFETAFGKQQIKNQNVLYRSDTGDLLGQVSVNRYNVVQPKTVLEFFRDLVALKGMTIETAGALNGGTRVWALARNCKEIRVKGTDVVVPYVLCNTSYDGTSTSEALFTTIRVVCQNTLNMARTNTVGNVVRVPHYKIFDEQKIKSQLGLIDEQAAAFEQFANYAAERKVTPIEAQDFVLKLFAKYEDETKKTLTSHSANTINAVVNTLRTAPGQNETSANGTAWGLLNGVTRYVDFEARAHSRDNRLESAWFGRGAELKQKAVEQVQQLMTGEEYTAMLLDRPMTHNHVGNVA